ncbi:hypothetical protein BN135_3399 [Cronobacter muytjensii 530]
MLDKAAPHIRPGDLALVFFYRSVRQTGKKLAIVYYGHQYEEPAVLRLLSEAGLPAFSSSLL